MYPNTKRNSAFCPFGFLRRVLLHPNEQRNENAPSQTSPSNSEASALFEKLVANLIASKLGKYVEVDANAVKVSLWRGNVVLNNVKLRKSALSRDLDLPLTVEFGVVETLTVIIPWTRLRSESVRVELDGVTLRVKAKNPEDFNSPEHLAETHRTKIERVEAAEAALLERLTKSKEAASSSSKDKDKDKESSAGTFERWQLTMANNLQVSLTRVALTFVDDFSSANESLAKRFTLQIKELRLQSCADDTWTPSFIERPVLDEVRKLVTLGGASVSYSQGALGAVAAAADGRAIPVLRPCDITLRAKQTVRRGKATWDVQLRMGGDGIEGALSREQYDCARSIVRFVSSVDDRAAFLSLRPACGVLLPPSQQHQQQPAAAGGIASGARRAAGLAHTNPCAAAWWRYAINAVLTVLRRRGTNGGGARKSSRWDLGVFHKQREYQALYKRYVGTTGETARVATTFLQALTGAEKSRLVQLEVELPVETVVCSRMLARNRLTKEEEVISAKRVERGEAAVPGQAPPPGYVRAAGQRVVSAGSAVVGAVGSVARGGVGMVSWMFGFGSSTATGEESTAAAAAAAVVAPEDLLARTQSKADELFSKEEAAEVERLAERLRASDWQDEQRKILNDMFGDNDDAGDAALVATSTQFVVRLDIHRVLIDLTDESYAACAAGLDSTTAGNDRASRLVGGVANSFSTFTVSQLRADVVHDQADQSWDVDFSILDFNIVSKSESLTVLRAKRASPNDKFLSLIYKSKPQQSSASGAAATGGGDSSGGPAVSILERVRASCDVVLQPFELSLVIPWLRRSYAFWQDDVNSLGAVAAVVSSANASSSGEEVATATPTTSGTGATTTAAGASTPTPLRSEGSFRQLGGIGAAELRLAEYFEKNRRVTSFSLTLQQIAINVIDRNAPLAEMTSAAAQLRGLPPAASSGGAGQVSECSTTMTFNTLVVENDAAALSYSMDRVGRNAAAAQRDDWSQLWKARVGDVSIEVAWTEFRSGARSSGGARGDASVVSFADLAASPSPSGIFRADSESFASGKRRCTLLAQVPVVISLRAAFLSPALMPPVFRLPGTQIDVAFPHGDLILEATEPLAFAALMNSVTLLLDFSGDSRGLRAVERASKLAAESAAKTKRGAAAAADASAAAAAAESSSFLAYDDMNAVVLQVLGPYEGLWEGADAQPTRFSFDDFEPWTMNATKAGPFANRNEDFVLRSVQARYGSISVMHESRPTYPMLKASLKQGQFLTAVHPVTSGVASSPSSSPASAAQWGTSLLLLRGGAAQPPGIARDVQLAKATLGQYGVAALPSVEQLRRCVEKVCAKLDAETAQVLDVQRQLRELGDDDPVPEALLASIAISEQLRAALRVAEIATDLVPAQCVTFLHARRDDAERFRAAIERAAAETPPAAPRIPAQLLNAVSLRFALQLDRFALRLRRPHYDPGIAAPSAANNFTEAAPLFAECAGHTSLTFESTWSGFDFTLRTSELQLFAHAPSWAQQQPQQPASGARARPSAATGAMTPTPHKLASPSTAFSSRNQSVHDLVSEDTRSSSTLTHRSSDLTDCDDFGPARSATAGQSRSTSVPDSELAAQRRGGVASYSNPLPVVCLGEAFSSAAGGLSAQEQQQQQHGSTLRSSLFSRGRQSGSTHLNAAAASAEAELAGGGGAGAGGRVKVSVTSRATTELQIAVNGGPPPRIRLDPSACGMFETVLDVTSLCLSWALAAQYVDCKQWTADDPRATGASFAPNTTTNSNNANSASGIDAAAAGRRAPHYVGLHFDFATGVEVELFHDARGLVGVSSAKLNAMMTNQHTGGAASAATPGAGIVAAVHPPVGKFSCTKLNGKWKMGTTFNSTSLLASKPCLTLAGKPGPAFLYPHPSDLSSSAPVPTFELTFDIQYRPQTTSYNAWLASGALGAASSGFAFSYSLGMSVHRCCAAYRQTYLWDLLEFLQASPVMKRLMWLTVRKPIDVHDRYSSSSSASSGSAPSTAAAPKGESSTAKPPFFHLMTQQQLRLVDTVLFLGESEAQMDDPAFCVHVPLLEVSSDLFPHVRRNEALPEVVLEMRARRSASEAATAASRSPSSSPNAAPNATAAATATATATPYRRVFVPPVLPFPFYGKVNGDKASAMPQNMEHDTFLEQFENDPGDPVSAMNIRCKGIRVFEKGAAQAASDDAVTGLNTALLFEPANASTSSPLASPRTGNEPSSPASASASSASAPQCYHTPSWVFSLPERWTPVVDMPEVRCTNYYTLAPMLLDLPLSWMAVDIPSFVAECSSASLAAFLRCIHGIFYEKWKASYTVQTYATNPYQGVLRVLRTPVIANLSRRNTNAGSGPLTVGMLSRRASSGLISASSTDFTAPADASFAASAILPDAATCTTRSGMSHEMMLQLLPVHDTSCFCFHFGQLVACVHDADDLPASQQPQQRGSQPLLMTAADLDIVLQWTSRGAMMTKTSVGGDVSVGFLQPKHAGFTAPSTTTPAATSDLASSASFVAVPAVSTAVAPSGSVPRFLRGGSAAATGSASAAPPLTAAVPQPMFHHQQLRARQSQLEHEHLLQQHIVDRSFLGRRTQRSRSDAPGGGGGGGRWARVRDRRVHGLAEAETRLIAAQSIGVAYAWSPVYGVHAEYEVGALRLHAVCDRLVEVKDTLGSLKMRNAFGRFLGWPDYVPGTPPPPAADPVNYQTVMAVRVAEMKVALFRTATAAAAREAAQQQASAESKNASPSPGRGSLPPSAARARSKSAGVPLQADEDQQERQRQRAMLLPFIECSFANFAMDMHYAPRRPVADMAVALDSLQVFARERPLVEFVFSSPASTALSPQVSPQLAGAASPAAKKPQRSGEQDRLLRIPGMSTMPKGVTPLVIDLGDEFAGLLPAAQQPTAGRFHDPSAGFETSSSSSTANQQQPQQQQNEVDRGDSFASTLERRRTSVLFVQYSAATGVYFVEAKNTWLVMPPTALLGTLSALGGELGATDVAWIGEHREERDVLKAKARRRKELGFDDDAESQQNKQPQAPAPEAKLLYDISLPNLGVLLTEDDNIDTAAVATTGPSCSVQIEQVTKQELRERAFAGSGLQQQQQRGGGGLLSDIEMVTVVGSRYAVSVVGLHVTMLRTMQTVVAPVSASVRATVFPRALQLAARVDAVVVRVDRVHYEVLLRTLSRHFLQDERAIVEEQASRRQEELENNNNNSSATRGSGSVVSFRDDSGSLEQTVGDLDATAPATPSSATAAAAGAATSPATAAAAEGYASLDVDVALAGFNFDVKVRDDCACELQLGGVAVKLTKETDFAAAAVSAAAAAASAFDSAAPSSSSRTQVEGSLDHVLIGLKHSRPLVKISALEQPVSLQALLAERERIVTASLGHISVWLDPVTVTVLLDFLYEPYRKIIMPKRGQSEIIVIDDDIKLDEPLLLTSQQLIRVSAAKKNYIRIDLQGHGIHFLPSLTPVILLDGGCTLELCCGKIFLYAGVRSVDAAVSAGNGSYTVLSAVEVIQSDEASGGAAAAAGTASFFGGGGSNTPASASTGTAATPVDFDEEVASPRHLGDDDDFDARGANRAGAAASGDPKARQRRGVSDLDAAARSAAAFAIAQQQAAAAATSPTISRRVQRDMTRAIKAAARAVSERDVFSVGLTIALPDAVDGLRELCLSTGIVLEREVIPLDLLRLNAKGANVTTEAVTSKIGARLNNFSASCRYYEASSASASASSSASGSSRNLAQQKHQQQQARNSRGMVLREVDFSNLIAPWCIRLAIDDTVARRIVSVAADAGVDLRLRCGDVAVVTSAVNSASAAVANIEQSVGGGVGGSDMIAAAQAKHDGTLYDEEAIVEATGMSAYRQVVKISIAFPHVGLYLIDDSSSVDSPLLYLCLFDIAAPTLDVLPATTVGHVQLKLAVEHFSSEAGLWQPLLEKVPVDVAFRDTAGDPNASDESKKEPSRRAGVNFGVVHAHITPPGLGMLLRAANVFSAAAATTSGAATATTSPHSGGPRHLYDSTDTADAMLASSAIAGDPAAATTTATTRVFRQYEIRHMLGAGLPVTVAFADDSLGRFPKPFTLHNGESQAFNFPRIDGQEIPVRQHMVLLTVGSSGHRSIPVFIGSVGEQCFQLPPGAPCPHVVVDVAIDGCKVVSLRLPIRFENELPFPIELVGVQDGVLLPGDTKHLTHEPLRKRCVVRPILHEQQQRRNSSSSSYAAVECGTSHFGLHFSNLHFLFGQVFLAAFPILGRSAVGAPGASQAAQPLPVGGADVDGSGSPRPVLPPVADENAAQRAVYALVSFSPLKVVPNAGGIATLPGTEQVVERQLAAAAGGGASGGSSKAPPASLRELQPPPVHDITVTFQPPFHVQNHAGVPIKVGLYYKQKFPTAGASGASGSAAASSSDKTGGYYAHIVSIAIDVEQTAPVTQISPVHDVYLDVMLTQPSGEVLSRTSGAPALVRSADGAARAASLVAHDARGEPLTLLIDYKPRLIVIRAAFWVVNHTMHYLQLQFPQLITPKPCAGCGPEGVPPMAKQPFLAGGTNDTGAVASLLSGIGMGAREDFEKRQQLRAKWKVQIRVGRYDESAAGGLVWTRWSDPIAMTSVTDAGDVTCPLERPTPEGDAVTLSFSNLLVGGAIADTMVLTFRARWIVLNRSPFDLAVFRGHNDPKDDPAAITAARRRKQQQQESSKGSAAATAPAAAASSGSGGKAAGFSNTTPFTTLQSQSSIALELCTRAQLRNNSVQLQCATMASGQTVNPNNAVVLESERSPNIPIDHIGEFSLNVRYVRALVVTSPPASPPLSGSAQQNQQSQQQQQQQSSQQHPQQQKRMLEFAVFRVSVYTRTSVMFVVIDLMKKPPYEVENRTPFLVSVRQEAAEQELLLYPFSTRGFVWEHEHEPHVLEIELTVSRGRSTKVTLDLDPLVVVRRTVRELKKDITVPGSQRRVFIRTRGRKDTFCISLTLDRRIDSMLTRPFAQLRFDVVLQGLFVLLADTERDTRRNLALLSLPEVFLSFAQGRLAERGAPPEDVQKIEVSFGSLQLEKWRSGADAQQHQQQGFGGNASSANSAAAAATSSPAAQQTDIIVSMLASPQIRKNSLVVLRRKDRAVPVLHVRYLALILQPLLLTVDDPFLEDMFAIVDRISATVAEANEASAVASSNLLNKQQAAAAAALNGGARSRQPPQQQKQQRPAPPQAAELRVESSSAVWNAGGDDDVGAAAAAAASTDGPAADFGGGAFQRSAADFGDGMGAPMSTSQYAFNGSGGIHNLARMRSTSIARVREGQQEMLRRDAATATADDAAAGASVVPQLYFATSTSATPIASSIFDTTPWSSELAAKSSDESDFLFKTVVIDSILLDQFVMSVTLVRGTDQSGRDPIKERLGVLALFVQSVDDARFDFHRIQKQNVFGKIWLLSSQLGHYYLARLKNQALNVVHIAVLDTLMRDVVNDLLDGYFTSAKVNIDRTQRVPSRKPDARYAYGVDDDDEGIVVLTDDRASGLPGGGGGGGRDRASSQINRIMAGTASAAALHQLATDGAAAPSAPGVPRVLSVERGFIIVPDTSRGFPAFDVDQKSALSVFRKLSRFVSRGGKTAQSLPGVSAAQTGKGGASSSSSSPSHKATICRCKMVSSALKKGQFPRETYGSPWIRLEELCHHAGWDDLMQLLPPAEIRMSGLLIAQLHARWRQLTVFTNAAASPVVGGAHARLIAPTAAAAAAGGARAAEQLYSNSGGGHNGGGGGAEEEGGYGCSRCIEIEALRRRRLADAVAAIAKEAALQEQMRAAMKRLEAISRGRAAEAAARGKNQEIVTEASIFDDDDDDSQHDGASSQSAAPASTGGGGGGLQFEDLDAIERSNKVIAQHLRVVQAPLPHPRTSLLSWEELCHHSHSWEEFVQTATDTELKRYGGLVQQTLLGLPRNITRIEKALLWALE